MRQWQDLLSTHVGGTAISLVVDLGCGTGRFSELLAAHFGAQVIGIDPSQKMLDQARQELTNSGVVFQQSSAEALPLAHSCVDLIFMSQVYHHLVRPIDFARECWRVLREGGYICIRNTTQEVDFVYRHFFQTMRPLIDSELPGRQEIARLFVSAGFAHAVHQIVTHVVARDWAELRAEIRPPRRLIPGATANRGVQCGNGQASRSCCHKQSRRCRIRRNRLVRVH
jgi:ubiquinone/menaquinone biosynthesis C-methylase UbiE